MSTLRPFFRFLLLFIPLIVSAQEKSPYPEVIATDIFSDPLFKQHQAAVDASQKLLALLQSQLPDHPDYEETMSQYAGQQLIFQYRTKPGETLYQTAADFSLSPDTLASLNGIERSAYYSDREFLLIPVLSGLYVNEGVGNELNRRLRSNRREDDFYLPMSLTMGGRLVSFRFYPGDVFSGRERLYFVSLPFRSPLDHEWIITSPFGYRNHPVLGHWEFHNGLDIRAPEGTDIHAIEKGKILSVSELDKYGLIIIIKHEGSYESRYAHLKKVFVQKGDTVFRGQKIAESGNSGISTGPHLHFEIRLNNKPVDPVKLVSRGSR